MAHSETITQFEDVDELTTRLDLALSKIADRIGFIWKPSTTNRTTKNLMIFKDTDLHPVFQTPPASGKTKLATDMVNSLFEDFNLPSIYFVLAHDLLDAVDGRESWNHWKGHSKFDCPEFERAKKLIDKGYYSKVDCDCGYHDQFSSDRPTIAPLDYIFGLDPVRLWGGMPIERVPQIRKEIESFKLRIIDEVDFNRFVDKMIVTEKELQLVANSHHHPHVRMICDSLREAMDRLSVSPDDRWNGTRLYSELTAILETEGNCLQSFFDTLDALTLWDTQVKKPTHEGVSSAPNNFPPYLVPILYNEIRRYLSGKEFNPKIHLQKRNSGIELRMRWRKWVTHFSPMLILDATANLSLLHRALHGFPMAAARHQSANINLPPSVKVYQWAEDMVGKGTLGLYPFDDRSKRDKWYRRIAGHLSDYQRDLTIGLVTHSDIEDEAQEQLTELGFKDVLTLHYWNLRSDNSLEDVDVLILFGCPSPNPVDLIEEAQAFFANEEPFETQWTYVDEKLTKRDGTSVPVKVGGYHDDERLQAYFEQKCQWELYQALHRCRPIRTAPNKEKVIFVYTNMPIPRTTVDGVLYDPETKRILDRSEITFTQLKESLQSNANLTVPELTALIADEDENLLSVGAWIRDNSTIIAERTSSTYVPGKGRRPGRFARSG